jgi:hypothetical protein
VKGDAAAPAFGLGSHSGAGQPACAPASTSAHTPSPVGARLLSLADGVREPRPHIQSPFSSLRGASGTGRGSTRIAGGAESERTHSCSSQARPARGCATASASEASALAAPNPSSRVAVTDATSSRRLDPERSERVDGERGAQSPSVCVPGAARLADTPAAVAVDAPSTSGAPRTTDQPSSTTHLHSSPTTTNQREGAHGECLTPSPQPNPKSEDRLGPVWRAQVCSSRAKAKHGKDAGRASSSATRLTENTAARRLAAARVNLGRQTGPSLSPATQGERISC